MKWYMQYQKTIIKNIYLYNCLVIVSVLLTFKCSLIYTRFNFT